MKLQSQLNLAFTTLLVVILTVVSFVIYSLIMDLLIQDERRQLEQTGELLVGFLNEQDNPATDLSQFNNFLQQQDLQLFMYDRSQDQVLFSTIKADLAAEFFAENNFSDMNEVVWENEGAKFVTSRILFYPEDLGMELILLTPMTDLRGVQENFFVRLFLVFLIGSLAAVLLSYFMTKRLVTPLSLLKRQLKKIEQRKFEDIERIKASGEIKEVEESVYEMAKELERYMNSQKAFFQNASHELKTPLMTIQGYAEGIKDGIFQDEEKDKGYEVMVSEVNRLKGIINEMILLAKLDTEPTRAEISTVNVEELINQIVVRALPMINEKRIIFEHDVEKDIYVKADEEKLLRALLNIVMNGIRHTDTRVRILVKRNNNNVRIVVEDDGKGIAKEDRGQIFHRFVKGKDGETGLGLAIARAVIEQLGGTISVSDSEWDGALFEIKLRNPDDKKKGISK